MDTYIRILKNILKSINNEEFEDMIKNILIKIVDIYFLERDIQKFNIDNFFKKYNMNMYNLLKKYVLTKSKNLIFKKHIYDKREYIIFLLKNYIISNDDETYNNIANEILKKDINCYTKYVNNYCKNRIVDNYQK